MTQPFADCARAGARGSTFAAHSSGNRREQVSYGSRNEVHALKLDGRSQSLAQVETKQVFVFPRNGFGCDRERKQWFGVQPIQRCTTYAPKFPA